MAWPGLEIPMVGMADFARLRSVRRHWPLTMLVSCPALLDLLATVRPWFLFSLGYSCFRRVAEPGLAFPLLNSFWLSENLSGRKEPPEPFLGRMSFLGLGCSGPCWSSISFICPSIREAWRRQVGEQLETRQNFKGLCDVDSAFAAAKFGRLVPVAFGMMHSHQRQAGQYGQGHLYNLQLV